MAQAGATTPPPPDTEKAVSVNITSPAPTPSPPHEATLPSTLRRWNNRIESLAGFEARGFERVPTGERHLPSWRNFWEMLLLWLSANMTIICTLAALTGPVIFGLGWRDSVLCVVFGTLLGAMSTAYMSTWGTVSGARTMVVARFIMGWYPSKLCALLNVVLMVGYCTLDNIVGGQVLSAVSGGGMSVTVGVVIVAVMTCVLAVFGLKVFHHYQRFAWLPQLIALITLIAAAAPRFTTSLPSTVSGRTLAANRLSFFSLMFYLPNSWVASAADYYVYYPVDTPKWKIFSITTLGLSAAIIFTDLIGVGLGTGVATGVRPWTDAYSTSGGALIVEAYSPVSGWGKCCSVVVALGVISNAVMGTYSAAIDCQILGHYAQKLPRYCWVIVLSIIELVCGLAGRNQLYIIFTNFLALMAYWLTIMLSIFVEEQVFFRGRMLDWEEWADTRRVPVGAAALTAFLLGWLGAVLGMAQIYFIGPLAVLSGYADVGMWVGVGFALISFPPLRWLELRKVGR